MASSILALAYSTFSLGSSSQALSSFLVYSSGCFTICGSCRDKRALWYRVNRTCMVIISFLCPVHKISISGHTGQIDAAVLIERTKCSKLAMITRSSPGQRIIWLSFLLSHLNILGWLVQAYIEKNDGLVFRTHNLRSDWLSPHKNG